MSHARSPEPHWLPRPGRDESEPPSGDAGLPDWLQERLFAQRIVALRGPITSEAITATIAMLLTLDAAGDEPVHLHLNAPDGELNAVFAVIDAIDMMRSPVHALVTAAVGGAAVGIVAVASHRAAYPHARFRLAEPTVVGVAGTADEMAAAAGRHLQAIEDLMSRVAKATGKTLSQVESDFSRGLTLGAAEAKDYGLIDTVSGG